ncbi:hypothetical protein [Fibrivirga algicola]|uniref:Uncharacterized protein n=1 Tax=Fibrivirga algicola TaxID=2950420 RepID=A0ABX0QNM4_9BACT|nr:hypothetical protein [Fibrivirga algicola]NID13752.1 hypothetical protein [Fibrivirga algicola]
MKKDKPARSAWEKATHTRKGYRVKDVTWNVALNLFLGMVADPLFTTARHPWVAASWRKDGKSANANRPDLDLVAPGKKPTN